MPNRVFVFSTPRRPRGPLAAAGALALGAVLVTAAVVASAAILVIGGAAALGLGLWARLKGARPSEDQAGGAEPRGPFAGPDGVIEGVRYAEVRVENRQPPHR